MKKIMFNDFCQLTQAVLEGKKTQTRRICRIQPPYGYSDIAFPCYWIDEDNPKKGPLYGYFCWANKISPQKHTDWIRPQYKVEEIVAVAQSYKDIFSAFSQHPKPQLNIGVKNPTDTAGWNNKMFVKGELMPHQIRITKVRIERIQDISWEDCLAEGLHADIDPMNPICNIFSFDGANQWYFHPREAYAALIDKISGKGTWDSNPYVWAYTFELVK